MSDVHGLMTAIARFLGEDVQEKPIRGTPAATRAELAEVCRSLAVASIAESIRGYCFPEGGEGHEDGTEDAPVLRLVVPPKSDASITATEVEEHE